MSPEHLIAIAGLLVAVVGGIMSTITALIAYFIKKNEEAQDKAIADLAVFANWARAELAKYELHVGAGKAALEALHTDVRDHVTREESIFWKKVEAMQAVNTAFQEANAQGHAAILQRLVSVEGKMPNGELERMALDIAKLVEQMLAVKEKAETAITHVREHDAEAEQWKRLIELTAKRVDMIESQVRIDNEADRSAGRRRR